jgi:uncharacterized MAPEG superfamily protein
MLKIMNKIAVLLAILVPLLLASAFAQSPVDEAPSPRDVGARLHGMRAPSSGVKWLT